MLLFCYDEKLHNETLRKEGYEDRQAEVDALQAQIAEDKATIAEDKATIAEKDATISSKDAEIEKYVSFLLSKGFNPDDINQYYNSA